MPKRISSLSIAFASLAFTYIFFGEYLSPFRKVYVPFDLWGYHYPLMDYAFQNLKHLSFPAWDPSIYSGQPFAANIQAALFYPPSWILYVLSAGHDHLSYRALEAFIFAHIWLAFLLSFCWLRNKRLSDLACILGAGIFAFSGYAMLQLQHQGLLCGYAWLPLGLWGIDDLTKDRNRPGFLKIAIASAACFLAGYPPMWLVLAIYCGIYALISRRLLRTCLALLTSLVLVAIQLLPTIEASSLMVKENRYGQPIREISFYLSYLVPNLYDFGIDVPAMTNFGREYLYLGAPALFGIAVFLRYPRWRPVIPLLACGAVCLILLLDPFHAVSSAIAKIPILAEVCGAWYFLAGLTATAAGVAAFGIDGFLTGVPKKPLSNTWIIAVVVCAAAWAIYETHLWSASAFRSGWWSALDALATLTVFVLSSFAARTNKAMAAVVLLCVAVDYKSFGTSKRFNARKGSLPHEYARDGFFAMDPRAFQALAAHPEYRILVDFSAPMPDELRHHGLATPQGFDPFVAQRYLDFVKNLGAHSDTDREFSFDTDNQAALATLAVRYAITTRNGPNFSHLEANPAFKLLGGDGYYFRVYEYQKFSEPFTGPATLLSRTPESRRFQVSSPADAEFVLKEQLFPGWRAYLDGTPIPIELWHGAFQSVHLPPGNHKLAFHYEPRTLRIGAWISVLSALLLAGGATIPGGSRLLRRLSVSLPTASPRDRSK
jgi:hypothetical protein